MQHILLVDDNLTSLKQAAALLKDTYKVSMVKSGSQALEFLEKFTPNLILLDIEMPQMDGFETIQRIKLDERFRKIPVIFLTGRGDRESVMEVMALKPAGYLLKSMRPIEIIQAINEFFEKQKGKMLEK